MKEASIPDKLHLWSAVPSCFKLQPCYLRRKVLTKAECRPSRTALIYMVLLYRAGITTGSCMHNDSCYLPTKYKLAGQV